MSTKSKTLAKSLHTVSAIVAVARHLMQRSDYGGKAGIPAAVSDALGILGYAGPSEPAASDPYGLAARAVAILEAGK